MENKQPHLLQLSHTHTSGAEEWICPTCGRRILIDWNGLYRSTILATGDPRSSHVGGCGQTAAHPQLDRVGAIHEPAHMASEERGTFRITEAMRPWLRWMHAAGLANGDYLAQ